MGEKAFHWIFVFLVAGLFTIGSPALAQDGSGSAQRTPQSAQAFLTGALRDSRFMALGKVASGQHMVLGSEWPMFFTGGYVPDGECRGALQPADVDDTTLLAKERSNDGDIVNIKAGLQAGPKVILASVANQYRKFAFHYSVSFKSDDFDVIWADVVSVVPLLFDFELQRFEITFNLHSGRRLSVYVPDEIMQKRVAAAADYLRNSCDKAANTGF